MDEFKLHCLAFGRMGTEQKLNSCFECYLRFVLVAVG